MYIALVPPTNGTIEVQVPVPVEPLRPNAEANAAQRIRLNVSYLRSRVQERMERSGQASMIMHERVRGGHSLGLAGFSNRIRYVPNESIRMRIHILMISVQDKCIRTHSPS